MQESGLTSPIGLGFLAAMALLAILEWLFRRK